MLDFCDEPYRDFPPCDSRLWRAVLHRYNRARFLPRNKRIASLTVHGDDTLRQSRRPGDRLVIVPNHPTHGDAAIMLEAMQRVGLTTQMMAAYDVFLRSRADAFVMQRLGAFSVDREGSDARAMKTALDVLDKGLHALTIFPEGNVYLENDRVTPFNDGAAFIALRAAHKLKEQGHRVLGCRCRSRLRTSAMFGHWSAIAWLNCRRRSVLSWPAGVRRCRRCVRSA